MDDVIGEWRKLRQEMFHNLHSSPSIIRMITSIRIRLEGHVASMGEKGSPYCVLLGGS
jgi:hypothetical protein